ncbi:MAG: DUF805 domain-containing protein [Alphaproteobacteria bacterium]|nr:DUF805 domain-containing protein [Alphaproteobacteria bacterium]
MPKTNSKKQTNVKKVAKKVPVKKVVKKTVKKTAVKKATVKKTVVKNVEKVAPAKQHVVSFGRAFVNFFKGYFNFTGTAQRSEYWWMVLAIFGPFFILVGITMFLLARIPMATIMPAEMLIAATPIWIWWLWVIYTLWTLVALIPMWALMARRLHDAGITAHVLWISLLFVVAEMSVAPVSMILMGASWTWSVVMVIFMLLPSKLKDNKYR